MKEGDITTVSIYGKKVDIIAVSDSDLVCESVCDKCILGLPGVDCMRCNGIYFKRVDND